MKKVMMEKPHWMKPSFSFTEVKTQAKRGDGLVQRHTGSGRQQPQAGGLCKLGFQRQCMSSTRVLMLCAENLSTTGVPSSETEGLVFEPSFRSPVILSLGMSGWPLSVKPQLGRAPSLHTLHWLGVILPEAHASMPLSAIHLPWNHRFQFHEMGSQWPLLTPPRVSN